MSARYHVSKNVKEHPKVKTSIKTLSQTYFSERVANVIRKVVKVINLSIGKSGVVFLIVKTIERQLFQS